MFTLPPKVSRQQLEKQDKATLIALVLNMQDNWHAADAMARQQDAMLLAAGELLQMTPEAKKLPPWLTAPPTEAKT